VNLSPNKIQPKPSNDGNALSLEARNQLLRRVADVLACPRCRMHLLAKLPSEELLKCPQCGSEGHYREGKFFFAGIDETTIAHDWLNRWKELAKRRLGRFYPLVIRILSPVHASSFVRDFISRFDTAEQLLVDLGSGTTDYGEHVVCSDAVGYPNVHVVCDLATLPFRDESIDGCISVAVLEHVPDPRKHVQEMWRVLRPGGRVLCYVPFMQGYHASPDDYQRYTKSGLLHLFRDFEIINVAVGAGPTSGMLWLLQEWLAIVFSFGSGRLYRALLPLTWLLSPLKYLDLLLARHPAAHVIASGLVIEARRPYESSTPRVINCAPAALNEPSPHETLPDSKNDASEV